MSLDGGLPRGAPLRATIRNADEQAVRTVSFSAPKGTIWPRPRIRRRPLAVPTPRRHAEVVITASIAPGGFAARAMR